MSSFQYDLVVGKEIELKHLKNIKQIFPDACIVEGYCKEWDIWVQSKNFGIEIKFDKMSQKTGNIVVEIMFDGKLSALSTTKAKFWFFDTGVKTIVVLVSELKELVKKFKTVKFTATGDTKQKEAYLIKQHFIEEICTRLEQG